MGRAIVSTAIVICAAAVAPLAQPQAQRFEVASVRLVPDNRQFLVPRQRLTDIRVDIQGDLTWILFSAFRLQYYEFQVSAPSWLNQVFVDIQATIPKGATVSQVPEMLQRLLEERFGLVVHRETRQVDGYELVVGSDGITMREVEPVNELLKEFPESFVNGRPSSDVTRETPDGPVRTISLPLGFRRITSRTMYERTFVPGGVATYTATRMSMAELAPYLWELMDAPVVDKSGLNGVYQFTLTLPRGAMTARLIEATNTRLRTSIATGPARAASSALEVGGSTRASTPKEIESLGLRLERRRVPLEVVVVDKIARVPTEN